jgi:[ribosomal protein S5]-alanine N-acetyltransferase
MNGGRPLPGQPELLTPRLRLRPFEIADGPEIEVQAGARAIADTTASIPHPYPAGAAAAWIASHAPAWDEQRALTYAITGKDGAALLGAVSLELLPAHASAELGYWIAVAAWGRGYATEAAAALCDFGFGPLKLHRIQARHLVRNPASGRVMRKLGMRHEGTLRDAVRKWDRFEDLALYAILAQEWTSPLARGGTCIA